MDATLLLESTFLAAFSANVVDWLVLRRGNFWWVPTGAALYVWQTCSVLIVATAILSFVYAVPSSLMFWVAVPPLTMLQLGAIWTRHSTTRPRQA